MSNALPVSVSQRRVSVAREKQSYWISKGCRRQHGYFPLVGNAGGISKGCRRQQEKAGKQEQATDARCGA